MIIFCIIPLIIRLGGSAEKGKICKRPTPVKASTFMSSEWVYKPSSVHALLRARCASIYLGRQLPTASLQPTRE
ncbi:MAG: hypothetical protein ACI8PG_004533 [Planctomycetota bacterium]|jgi:hypothetical protein